MSDPAPVINVDLIEDDPWTREEWAANRPRAARALGDAGYATYLDRYQPFRLLVKSGDNHEALFRSTERYFNEADARHAAELAFGSLSNVFLRQAERGNEVLRRAVPQ